MSVKKTGAVVSRRGFLKSVAATGGAVAVTAVAAESANAATSPGSTEDPEAQNSTKGYHVTPHILDYYEKARF